MGSPIVLIHCQYVYGLGHLIRSLKLAEGLVNFFDIYLLCGGQKVHGLNVDPKIHLIELDALYKEENSNKLLSVDENLTVKECLSNRGKLINALIENISPDLIITEHFPFGFLFEHEVLALITKAKEVNKKAKVICSVRDIIESKKGSDSDNTTVEILNQYYDLLLVHGDETVIPFETSFSLTSDIEIRRVTTGYILDSLLKCNTKRKKTIVVSIAGGRIGKELKSAVISAYKSIQNDINHKLLVFDGAFTHDFEQKNNNEKIEFFKFDRNLFLEELAQSDVSISLGGYNTTVESLYSANKVLIYSRKFLDHNFEQEMRIAALSDLGLIRRLNAQDLEQKKLASILLEAIYLKSMPSDINLDFDGVERSVQEIKDLIND